MTDLQIAKLKIRRQTDRRTTKPSFLTIDADWSSNLQQVELRLKNSETDNRRNAQRSIEAVKFSGDFYRSVQPVPWIARYFTYGGTRRSHVNDDWNSQERKLGEHRRPERSRSSRLNTNDARYLRTCDTAPDSNFSNVANSWNSENLAAKFPDTVHSTGRWYPSRLWSRDPRTRCLWDRSSSEISEARTRWKKMKRWYRWSRWILVTCGCESRPRSRGIRAVLRADAALAEADRLANY